MAIAQQSKKNNQTSPFGVRSYEFNHFENKINPDRFTSDSRMRFRNSRDPIYIAFDYLDTMPLDQLAKDFLNETIKDTLSAVMNFISFAKK